MTKRLPCPVCGSLDREPGVIRHCSRACRVAANVEIAESGCWNWTGLLVGDGYGKTWVSGTDLRAHRLSWECLVSPIPSGLVLDHLCRNPKCVNPDHLEPVTTAENVARSSSPSTLNATKTECVNGHRFTPENTRIGSGQRSCRACDRANSRAYRLRRAEAA